MQVRQGLREGRPLHAHSLGYCIVAWHPQRECILSTASSDGNVYEWDLRRARSPARTFLRRETILQVFSPDSVKKKRKIDRLPTLFRMEIEKTRKTTVTSYRGVTPACESTPIAICYSPSGARLLVRTFRGLVPLNTSSGLEEIHRWSAIKESLQESSQSQLLCCPSDTVYTTSGSRLEQYTAAGVLQQHYSSLVGDVTAMCYSRSDDCLFLGEADGLVSRWEQSEVPLKDPLYERTVGVHLETQHAHPPGDVVVFPGSVRLLRETGPVADSVRSRSLTFLPLQRSHLLCVIAVPPYVPPPSLESCFHLAPEDLNYARVILHSGGIYTVIFSFQSQARADRFYQEFNGHEFSEHSLEMCYVVFLSEIVFMKEEVECDRWMQLPSCPVCLERLDVSCSGIVGVLRSTQADLPADRWLETASYCKVCQMVGRPTSPLLKLTHSSSLETVHCEACAESSSLWICLLCGYIGCGRYSSAHAHTHCEARRHNFVLELDTQRIWDYLGDNYVHRLIRTGPGLFFPDSHIEASGEVAERSDDVEMLAWEYNYLINSQLEQQRIYFEGKIEERLRSRDSEPLVESLQDEIIALQIAAQEKHKALSRMKAMEKKRVVLAAKLAKETEEQALLAQVNDALKQRLTQQNEGGEVEPKFADKKSKELFLKKQKLQKRVQDLMQRISAPQ